MSAADSTNEFATLLAAARAKDPLAIEQVLLLTESRLRNFIEARLGPELRTRLRNSDVLQNSYLQMLDALPDFDGSTREDFVRWVTQIIENDIRRQARWFGAKKRRQPRTSERNVLARILFDPPLTPSAELGGMERAALVQRALAQLEPDQAEVIRLALLQELPHGEVAHRMGRSEGACRMLLMRARAAFALAIEQLQLGDT